MPMYHGKPLPTLDLAPGQSPPSSTPAAPDDSDAAFLAAISGDGITMDEHEATLQGRAACLTLESGTSMWDTIQQVEQAHGWHVVPATNFVDRAIQN